MHWLTLSPEEWTVVQLSLRVALVATLFSLPFGIAIAMVLARGRFWGRSVLDGLVLLPLILPPVVTGYERLRRRDCAQRASGVLVEMSDALGPIIEIRLDCNGEAPLLARPTRCLVERRGLAPGKVGLALIKIVALDRCRLSGPLETPSEMDTEASDV